MEEQESINLTDKGIRQLDIGLSEYLRINRQHIIQLRDQEIQKVCQSYDDQVF